MATSRTGTAAYQHWRRRVLARGRVDGVTCCPSCGVVLDYEHGMKPNSAARGDNRLRLVTGASR